MSKFSSESLYCKRKRNVPKPLMDDSNYNIDSDILLDELSERKCIHIKFYSNTKSEEKNILQSCIEDEVI